jgi:hypothetical protein
MATLTQPAASLIPAKHNAAEQSLLDVFDEIVDDLSPEQRTDFFSELRSNAQAHGE